MSKKRNQVQFTKPEDPKFLKLIKQQAGYRDGPTVDAKRAKYDSGEDSDYSDKDEELPQVVVVSNGDLTADEAEREKQRLDRENNTKPADLTERIVFKAKDKSKSSDDQFESKSTAAADGSSAEPPQKSKKSRKAAKETKSKLSFAFEDDDEEQ